MSKNLFFWASIMGLGCFLVLSCNSTTDDDGPDAGSDGDADSEADLDTDSDVLACTPAKPSGYCDVDAASVCLYETDVCNCTPVCSGAPPLPGETHEWICAPPPLPACPESPPTDGSACSPNGTKCSWGTCGITQAECITGKWEVTDLPPPP